MSDVNRSKFEQRFQGVVRRMRMTRVLTVLGWAVVALTAILVSLACVDYLFETDWNVRALIVGTASVVAILGTGVLVMRALHRWNRRSTAAQVERRFEDLGQSVRTAVQLRDDGVTGVSPSLLRALNDDVHEKTEELRLTEAVATGPLKLSAVCLGLLSILAVIACSISWDWRVAASRALLGNQPYTTVAVKEGDVRVDEKATFTINTSVEGRIDRDTQLRTRLLDDDVWDTRSLTAKDETVKQVRLVSYSVDIPKIKKPFEYQVVSGKYTSPVHRVDVRYPLDIQAFNIELTSPEYTGIGTRTLTGGSFEAVEGSHALIAIELDHEPQAAWLELQPIVTPLGEEPTIERVRLAINGPMLNASLDLQRDRFYSIHAETADGTKIKPNRFRIRVHEDRPPRIAFQGFEQSFEVHSLAEVLMKLKIADDYGLRRAGIVFQRNNEEEFPLAEISYEDIQLEDGRMTPQTKAAIERLFPLEYFRLTVNDSISFYGYAEDNRPGTANRNETDLHFIDVRPFRRQYAQPDENGLNGMGNNNNNPNRRNLPLLNEMIDRQRITLNRTMQMQRQNDRGKSIAARDIDNLINSQNESSDKTFQMAQVAEAIELEEGVPPEGRISELLFQARLSMLASIDALNNTEFEVAKLQEKDALQHLVNARQRLDDPIRSARLGGAAARARARLRAAFTQMARQRQRRQPTSNAQRARMIVERLRQAASQQEFLMDKMSDLEPPVMPEVEDQEQRDQTQQPEAQQSQEMEDEIKDDEVQAREELRRELEDEQEKLTDEIQGIVEMIEELERLSSLAGQRSSRAMSGVSGVVGSLQRRNTQDAMANARAASARLRILADNIAGVTADESTKRIEIARDLGLMLTDDIRELEQGVSEAERKLDDTEAEGAALAGMESELTEPLSQRAEEQSEIAKTIQDILASITNPDTGISNSEDLMVKRLEEIMTENELETNIGRMQQLSGVIDSMAWTNAAAETSDLSERFDIVSQRLDAMHRELLSPRLEQLRRLEKRALQANTGLANLQSDDHVNRWHLRTDGLLEDIANSTVAETQVAAMQEMMTNAGWGTTTEWDWKSNADGTALQAPEDYGKSLGSVITEIQRHIREMSLRDVDIQNTGAIPPQYKVFVDRYMEVLTGAADPAASMEGER